MKRIKNYFDNYKGDYKDVEFILNGGLKMKYWIDQTLNQMRANIKMTKTNRANAEKQTNSLVIT
jgi:hypothetical protein